MAQKTITKTDVSKRAIVVTRELQDVLRSSGKLAVVRGDRTAEPIQVWFRNLESTIQLHYYSSERRGAGRTPEPRCWHQSFGTFAKVGRVLVLEEAEGRLELEIR